MNVRGMYKMFELYWFNVYKLYAVQQMAVYLFGSTAGRASRFFVSMVVILIVCGSSY